MKSPEQVSQILTKAKKLEVSAERMELVIRTSQDPKEIAGASQDMCSLYMTSIEAKLAVIKNL
jgi:hypothetical protein